MLDMNDLDEKYTSALVEYMYMYYIDIYILDALFYFWGPSLGRNPSHVR